MQLGLIQALLAREGIAARTFYPTLLFAERIGPELYRMAADDFPRPQCEWVWSQAAFGSDDAAVEAYIRHLVSRGERREHLRRLRSIQASVEPFLEVCLERVLATEPKVVGFTTSMLQVLPAAALARRIRASRPDIQVVLGGAPCQGVMGPALMRALPVVDVIVQEECDAWVGELFRRLLDRRDLSDLAGILFRRGDEVVVNPRAGAFHDLEGNPAPDFSDYFEELGRSSLRDLYPPSIPFEGSRGCWWGERRHCAFCGLNGLTMTYRHRSAAGIVDELAAQRQRYSVDTFIAVDEIIPGRFFDELPPLLTERLPDAVLFYEMTPAVPRDGLERLARSVTLHTQPGVESLSTRVLYLMNKRLRGIDNVCLLRRAAELGINLLWNVLFGIPGERLDDYEPIVHRMAALYHLTPPNPLPLTLARFSPYHEDPARYGIRITGPQDGLSYAYPVPRELLDDIAMNFDFEYQDGYDREPVAALLRDAVERWKAFHPGASLTVELRGDQALIEDTRLGRVVRSALDPVETLLYRHMEHARDARSLARKLLALAPKAYLELGGEQGVRAALSSFYRKGILWREGDGVVAIAVPTDPGFWIREPRPARAARLPVVDRAAPPLAMEAE